MDRITQEQLAAADLQPDPIPHAWVLSGAPLARTAELSRSADGARATVLWDCTSGEYMWRYAAHEAVEILEGEAMVDDGSGPRLVGVGGKVRFRAGAIARWRVPAYVKKVVHRRVPQSAAMRLGLRLARRLRSVALGRTGRPDAGLPSHI